MTAAAAVLCLIMLFVLACAGSFVAGVIWSAHVLTHAPASQSNEGSISRHGNRRSLPDLDTIRGFVQVGEPASGEWGAEAGTYRPWRISR